MLSRFAHTLIYWMHPPLAVGTQGRELIWAPDVGLYREARAPWDTAPRAGGERSVRAQAILDRRSNTKARYWSAITQLVETEYRFPSIGVQDGRRSGH